MGRLYSGPTVQSAARRTGTRIVSLWIDFVEMFRLTAAPFHCTAASIFLNLLNVKTE
jgi:hypothetical protein